MQAKRRRLSCSSHQRKDLCPQCDVRMTTYSRHISYWSPGSPYLLGSPEQFCESFFHVFKCPEFKIDRHVSITHSDYDTCRLPAITMLVKYGNFIARYTNCKRVHTEQIMIEDPQFRRALQQQTSRHLRLWIKYQPCHHSGGNANLYPEGYLFQGKSDNRSCTERLLDFHRKVLVPLKIDLCITISNIYKANWEFATREDDIVTVRNARQGLQMLINEPGVEVRAMEMQDWQFLLQFVDNVKLNQVLVPERLQTDQGVKAFLDTLKKTP